MLPYDIKDIFSHCEDCEVDPPECLTTSLGPLEVASQAKDEVTTATVVLGSDTPSSGKRREYAQRCPSANGTVGSAPFTMNVELLPGSDIEGASDVVTTTAIQHDDGVNMTGATPRLIVIDGNVGGIDVVVRTRLSSDDPGSSARVVKEIFKAQVEKSNG